jgi:hypothetical protein
VVQRHVLYLGEINSSQELAWRKSIDLLEDGQSAPRTYALFPEDRCEGLLPDESIVRLKLKSIQLHRPRQWGACWLALTLWQTLDLDVFWAERLPPSRKGTRWDLVLFVLGAYRLIAPGVLLYDLTSTYFESDPPLDENDKRRHGYSRDHRFDCVQIVIALIVTPEGLPLAYEILPGNTDLASAKPRIREVRLAVDTCSVHRYSSKTMSRPENMGSPDPSRTGAMWRSSTCERPPAHSLPTR